MLKSPSMPLLLQLWCRSVEKFGPVRFIDAALRGAGQVVFQDHPLTGLIILTALLWGSPLVGAGSVIGLSVATATAMALRVDGTEIRRGLYGYNGLLVGAGITTFLVMTPLTWLVLVLGAASSILVGAALTRILATWHLPPLTAPFVLTTILVLLCAYAFTGLPIAGMAPPAFPEAARASGAASLPDLVRLGQSTLKGIGQIFLIGNAVTGALILVALAVSSLRVALLAVMGAATGLVVALVCGAPASMIEAGLYSFSPALTAIALGSVFVKPTGHAARVAFIAAVATVFVQAGMTVALAPLGVPPLTGPFVVATWCFLLWPSPRT